MGVRRLGVGAADGDAADERVMDRPWWIDSAGGESLLRLGCVAALASLWSLVRC